MGRYTVACYYFPNYHVDPRNEEAHGPGWTEWELVKRARPRWHGHRQPRVPLWGYEDEADPEVMARKIDAAADHGIDAWIFDWYHYDDGPFLQRCLEEGLMRAHNVSRIRFGLMWANHDWINIHPCGLRIGRDLMYPGAVTPATFDAITDRVVER
ncbi:MAG: glycoside hydrolase family 99-like domain-containing protein [Anaerolineae bacterium]|nr:glycoside hydrolase family 99-like domain-containing protein [Anaerolineae bacterium]